MKAICIFILYGFVFLSITSVCLSNEKQLVISSGMQYEYAQKLFSERDYESAIVEFKRFIYFFPDSPLNEQAIFDAAMCQFYLKKYKEAARRFDQIILKDKESDITKKSVFYQSLAFMKMGNTGYAEVVLQNYLKLVDDTPTKDQIYFNLSMIHLSEAKKGKSDSLIPARNYLQKMSPEGADKYQTSNYKQLILNAEQAPQKNPTAAGIFAAVPGGGFLYCERYKDALVTFLLNAGLMIAAYQAWDNDNEALAGVIGFVETGFYTANIYGSVSSAHKYNKTQVLKILNQEFHIRSKVDPGNKGLELSLNFPF